MFHSLSTSKATIFGAVAVWIAIAPPVLAAGRPAATQSATGPATQPGVRTLNADLVNLPANTWVKIKPNRNPAGRSYSGVGGAIGSGCIFYFGGAHLSHPSNDVELYDIATNTWIQATEPEDWHDVDKWTHLTEAEKKQVKSIPKGNSYDLLTPKGRPITQHTYQYTCYDPEGKRFISVLISGTWAFDPAKRDWEALAGRHAKNEEKKFSPASDAGHYSVAYDPVLKRVICVCTNNLNCEKGTYFMDPQTGLWKRMGGWQFGWDCLYSSYVPEKKAHLFSGVQQNKWFWFDAVTAKWEEVKSRPAECKGVNSLAYDPDNRTVLAVVNDFEGGKPVTTWAFDVTADSWTKVETQGPKPQGITAWNLLNYDPDNKCFLFLNLLNVGGGGRGGRTDGLFAFRLKK